MTPTMRLRFIERNVVIGKSGSLTYFEKTRILQQWWAIERHGQITPDGEWRDVPLEIE